jgi:hypothetical protein
MALTITCPDCLENRVTVDIGRVMTRRYGEYYPGLIFGGTLTCLQCEHRWPLEMRNSEITFTASEFPASESRNLSPGVPPGLRQDIEEAERCHYGRCDKAGVVMCRRAIQLGLIEKGIPDAPFSRMIGDAQARTPALLTASTFAHVDAIKEFGDRGAHRTENVTANDLQVAIYATVKALNELFP